MSYNFDSNDEALKDKLEYLLDEDIQIKKWYEGLLIKFLILLPTIIFIVGLFIVNRPSNMTDVLYVLFYPLALILLGLIILFVMRINLK